MNVDGSPDEATRPGPRRTEQQEGDEHSRSGGAGPPRRRQGREGPPWGTCRQPRGPGPPLHRGQAARGPRSHGVPRGEPAAPPDAAAARSSAPPDLHRPLRLRVCLRVVRVTQMSYQHTFVTGSGCCPSCPVAVLGVPDLGRTLSAASRPPRPPGSRLPLSGQLRHAGDQHEPCAAPTPRSEVSLPIPRCPLGPWDQCVTQPPEPLRF